MAEETIQEMQDVFASEEDENLEEGEVQDETSPEEDENTEEEIEIKVKSSSEDDEEEKETKKVELPAFKEVTKKYPNLFKDFPHLRHTFFHAKEYRELFPTLEDARDAVEQLEGLKGIEEALTSGKVEELLQSFNEMGEEVVPTFSQNFLPSLRKVNQDLYYQVITPELVNFTKAMFDAGLRNENDNLKNAALVAALHFFGDPKVASGERKIETQVKKETQKDDKLEKERQSFRLERYNTFYNDIISNADSQLVNSVVEGIDPRNTMTEGMKELVTERVIKEISKVLSTNNSHISRMNSLWKKASESNFSSQWKSKIISAYLEAAQEVMPKIRAKVRANVLGIRERHPEKETGGNEKRVEPKSTVGSSGSRNGNDKLNAKKINWKKTSDLDLIQGNITYNKD